MKKDFFDYMHTIMDENPDVYFLMAGLGYPRVDEFLAKYPDRAFNTEASEQATLDIAIGLCYANKIPVVYSITPFLLYRGFETLRTYINHEELPVILVGVGRKDDYSKHDGFSHYAGDDYKLFGEGGILDHITQRTPLGVTGLHEMMDRAVQQRKPTYINIPR
jgi:transketolase